MDQRLQDTCNKAHSNDLILRVEVKKKSVQKKETEMKEQNRNRNHATSVASKTGQRNRKIRQDRDSAANAEGSSLFRILQGVSNK